MGWELRKENPTTARRPETPDRKVILLDLNGNPLIMDYLGVTNPLAQFDGSPVASDKQTSDPLPIAGNRGWRYSKLISGVVEDVYEDDQGRIIQITDNGRVAGGGIWDVAIEETVQTINATPALLATYATLADNRVIDLTARVFCHELATGDVAKYVIEATVQRNGSSVLTLKNQTKIYEYEDQSAWNAAFSVSSQDVQIYGTGEASKTIEWRCQLEVSEHG